MIACSYLNLDFIFSQALVPVTSSARKMGRTNIKEVSNAEKAVAEVMILSEIHVMINIVMRMMPCPIHVFAEKGCIIEDHFGSAVDFLKTSYV